MSRYYHSKINHHRLKYDAEALSRFNKRLEELRAESPDPGYCLHCAYYVPSVDAPSFGSCMRYAPGSLGTFPDVEANDWCGDFFDHRAHIPMVIREDADR